MGHGGFVVGGRAERRWWWCSCGVVQGFGDHYGAYGLGGAVFGQAGAAEAGGEFVLEAEELAVAGATGAGASFLGVGAVGLEDIKGHGGDAGHGFLVLFEFGGEEAAFVVGVGPGGVGRVAEDELGADAGDFTGGGGGLGVAKVGEELDGAFEAFGGDGIGGAFGVEFEEVEDLAAGGEEPAGRMSLSQARNWARKRSEVMVMVSWRRWTASGPS